MEPDPNLNLIEVAMRESGLYGDSLSDMASTVSPLVSVDHNASATAFQQTIIPAVSQNPRPTIIVLSANANSNVLNPVSSRLPQIAFNRGVAGSVQNGASVARPVVLNIGNMNTLGGTGQQRIVAISQIPNRTSVPGGVQRIALPLNPRTGTPVTNVRVASTLSGSSPSGLRPGGQLLTHNTSQQNFQQIRLRTSTGTIQVPSGIVRSTGAIQVSEGVRSIGAIQVPGSAVRNTGVIQIPGSVVRNTGTIQVPASAVRTTGAIPVTSMRNPGTTPIPTATVRTVLPLRGTSSLNTFVRSQPMSGVSAHISQTSASSNQASFQVIPVSDRPQLVAAASSQSAYQGVSTVQTPGKIMLQRPLVAMGTVTTGTVTTGTLTAGSVQSQTQLPDVARIQSVVPTTTRMLSAHSVSSLNQLNLPGGKQVIVLAPNGGMTSQAGPPKTERQPQLLGEMLSGQSLEDGSIKSEPSAILVAEEKKITDTDASASGDVKQDAGPGIKEEEQVSSSDSEDDGSNFYLAALKTMRKMKKEADENAAKKVKETRVPETAGTAAAPLSDAPDSQGFYGGGQLGMTINRPMVNAQVNTPRVSGDVMMRTGQLNSTTGPVPFLMGNQRPGGVRISTLGMAPNVTAGTFRSFSPSGVASNPWMPSRLLPPVTLTNQVPRAVYINRTTGAISFDESMKIQRLSPSGTMLSGSPNQQVGFQGVPGVEMDDDDEELGHAETYESYRPAKLTISQFSHPDKVVESSSLSSIEPPDIDYQLSIPEAIIDEGRLSALQLEAITYACQKHETFLPDGRRVGYLIGDGAGVGKGRTISGIILENFKLGRKRGLWLSVSNDLLEDARRDLDDIGAHNIKLRALNKLPYGKINSKQQNQQRFKKGIIFGTYSSLIGESNRTDKYRTRMKQLIHWLGKDFDGVIIFDECHRAKNLHSSDSNKSSKTGRKVLELQRSLPNARIVYASATGASEPKHMGYMDRLGLWGPGTPFSDFDDFHLAIKKRGVGAMELVAMEMKQRGTYMARQLSFEGVNFDIVIVQLTDEFAQLYNDCVALWVKALSYFQKAIDLLSLQTRDPDSKEPEPKDFKKSLAQYWSAHQRFFGHICISSKVPWIVKFASEKLEKGFSIVIGLQSTGESKMLEQVDSIGPEMSDFVSTAKGVFQTLIEKHFPTAAYSDYPYERDSLFSQSLKSKNNRRKRKRAANRPGSRKRVRLNSSDDDSSVSDSSSDNEVESVEVSESDNDQGDDEEPEEGEEKEEEEESSEEDSESDEDRNPFAEASGSDFDDEPAWVRRPKKKAKLEETEKKSAKTSTLKNKKKKTKQDSSDDDFTDAFEQQSAKDVQVLFKKETSIPRVKSTTNQRLLLSSNMSAGDKITAMKSELLEDIENLGPRLPSNTLDNLIEKLGGKDSVAEMTGRKDRLVMIASGIVQLESRADGESTLETINNTEREKFMRGYKRIAIISEAASSGISLHADRRYENRDKRIHITLELPWSADKAIQQFGRTHRSNQVHPPEYVFVISELAGEQRFAATVAKRLESLGALTHGDRRAAETRDLSQFNIDNKYGQDALKSVFASISGIDKPLAKPPSDYPGNFFKDVQKALADVGLGREAGIRDKDHNQISKFLNRILGMEVRLQNSLFQYFLSTLEAVILAAKREGSLDAGILDLGSSGEKVEEKDSREFSGVFSGFQTKIRLTSVSVERGINWSAALSILNKHRQMESGFYKMKTVIGSRILHILAIGVKVKNEVLYRIYRPNMGAVANLWAVEELKKKYTKVSNLEDVKPHWEDNYTASEAMCSHYYQFRQCRNRTCESGKRCRMYHILSGSVLSIWTNIERILRETPGSNAGRMQVIRIKITKDNRKEKKEKRIVGIIIPPTAVEPMCQFLQGSEFSKTKPRGESTSTSNISIISASRSVGNFSVLTNSRSTTSIPSLQTSGYLPGIPSVQSVSSFPHESGERPTQPEEKKPILSMPKFF